jgi:tetratricopeptide (TPR) repeat protein
MTQQQKTRREKLEEFLTAHPEDAFARYGLALECGKAGDHLAAIEHFQRLLAEHPEYVGGYFHYGQLLAKLARTEEAKEILSAGIVVARRVGDHHAGDEMQAALTELR